MNFGEYDVEITLQSPTETPNAVGDLVTTYSTVLAPWASKLDLTGRETFDSRARMAEVDTKFETHYCSELDGLLSAGAKWRLLEGSIVYDVVYASGVPGGRPSKIWIFAKRRADG